MIKIAPSLLSADFSNLSKDIKELEVSGADWLHLDIMDGAFAPNISFGIPVIKSIRNITQMPFDAHLMIENPSKYVEAFALAGADIITVHLEADNHIDRTVNQIKALGKKAGIAINPGTPVCLLDNIIEIVDMVLIMSVNPGFGGQKYIEYSSEKIKQVRSLAEKKNKDLLIQVDGGIQKNNIKKVIDCGANVIVAGSSVFENGTIKENISNLRLEF